MQAEEADLGEQLDEANGGSQSDFACHQNEMKIVSRLPVARPETAFSALR